MKKQSRKEFIKILGGIGVLGLIPSYGIGMNFLNENKVQKLTILSTNDMHSRLEPFSAIDKKYANMGGFAQRANIISDIRQTEENVILLDAGDIFQGTPYFNMYGGEPEFKLMSKLSYDAATIGNHEFDNGIEGFNNALRFAEFPFICSNYDFSETILKDKTIPYKIIKKGSVKIGVIGIGIKLKGLVSEKNYGKTIYQNPIEKANEYAKLLKEKKCDFIICLSHLGYDYLEEENKIGDREFVRKTRNIDYVIGGHSHTFMEAAKSEINLDGKLVPISHSGWGGLLLGRLDIEFAENGKIKKAPLYTTKEIKSQ